MKRGDILFLDPMSVRPSVCLSVTCLLNIVWTPGRINKLLCTNVKVDETMCSAYNWPSSGQGQGHNLRLSIVWLYFVSALYLLNPWWDLQITLHKCQVWWNDVQCIGLTKVGSRSRSQIKIKHCTFRFRKHPSSYVCFCAFVVTIMFTKHWYLIMFAILKLPLHNLHSNKFHPDELYNL